MKIYILWINFKWDGTTIIVTSISDHIQDATRKISYPELHPHILFQFSQLALRHVLGSDVLWATWLQPSNTAQQTKSHSNNVLILPFQTRQTGKRMPKEPKIAAKKSNAPRAPFQRLNAQLEQSAYQWRVLITIDIHLYTKKMDRTKCTALPLSSTSESKSDR